MATLIEYDTIITELFKRFPSVQQAQFKDAYKPGLGRMEEFDDLLGHPHQSYPTIHVAGTNGKGSVCNMLAAALSGVGLKVGLYTSPHIEDFRERIRIRDGKSGMPYLIEKQDVLDFIDKWRPTFERLDLSFFEITTAMAFAWFADQEVDVAVIEVGLGGRLDSTNIIVPKLSIVTCIGLDHCQYLGDTLEKIAAEKAGIFKAGVRAVVGESEEHTSPVFKRKFEELSGGRLIFADKVEPSLWYAHNSILDAMDLRGEYQANNLRTVLAAIDLLKTMSPFEGLNDDNAVCKSIEKTASAMDFHGRWERLSVHPDVICDIGHNAHALKYNFHQLDQYVQDGKYSSLIIIYGVMADKDLDSIMPMMPRNAIYIFTTPSTSRALPSEKILARYLAFCDIDNRNKANVYKSDSVREAIKMAITIEKKLAPWEVDPKAPAPLIYIGGSTFVVADAVPFFAAIK